MRIVGFFLKAFLGIALIGALFYFVVSSMWLAIGSGQFVKDAKALSNLIDESVNNAKTCKNAPASSALSKPKAVQLRFLNDHDYVVELVCSLIETTPIEILRGSLPALISKSPGTSGFYVDLANPKASTVELRSLYAKKQFIFSGKLLPAGASLPADLTVSAPVTSCAGWGYQCCQDQSEIGGGDSESIGVSDCPKSCAGICLPRPYIVAFVSDPYPSVGGEVLMDTTSLSVTFSYTAEVTGGTIKQVDIDYGDGQKDTSIEATGVFSHTYSCVGPCRYSAQISAMDQSGNLSLASDVTTLYIVKR